MAERDRRESRKRLIFWGGITTTTAALLISAIWFWHWAFHDLPTAPDDAASLWSTRRDPSVTLQDRQGEVLAVRGPLYAPAVALDSLPEHTVLAFLAIEDRRFYEHDGIDRRGIARALWRNFRAGQTVQGGSTITMQLVKNLILTPERSIRRKLQEMRLARALERNLTKTEILELYLNRIYLGANAYGIEAAARRYFDKSASELTLAESALLAALPKAPSRLDPTANLAAAQQRAARVIAAMADAGYITEAEAIGALALPAEPVPGTIIPAVASRYGHVFDYAIAEARRLVPEDIPDLVIRTTIDREMLEEGQAVLNAFIAEEGETSQVSEGAIVVLEPDGAIRSMVGGREYVDSQFNRAVQAQRQPGSAFKPIVFAAAVEAGADPSMAVWDEPVDLEGWSPQNFSGNYRGLITLQDALKRSINTVAAQIADEIGIPAVIDMGRRMGIRSDLPNLPALALGAGEVNLLELTGAYATIANEGERQRPYLVLSVSNSLGDELYRHSETAPVRAMSVETAHAMSTMMQDVILSGTGRRAALSDRQVAGKTGTSQSFRDAWFIGFTADYTAGVWVGNDDDSPMNEVTGGGLPARIWQDYMTRIHADRPARALSANAPRVRTEREDRLAAFYSELSGLFSDVLEDGATVDDPSMDR
ncbi:transglycosylase domain-containing protein [Maricaulis sp. D1M11]|uniref:transglycosylase domain-containing protein n=1 Tax=Maricaulis sp. D1M11 TaxID=3076117 RepID=UPI0039B6DD6A